jgi:hypothetical protein
MAAEPLTDDDVLNKLKQRGTDRFLEQVENGFVNPIEFARALDVKPQMIYNYITKGKITTIMSSTQKKQIVLQDAVEFAKQYMQRAIDKQERIEAELAGIEVS